MSSEGTGHAEAVRISFDPKQISYAQLLEIYFTVAHDPTQVDRQGPDSGHSYRSAIFPQTPDQARFAKAFIARLNASHAYKAPVATRIESGGFYPAEAYHQGSRASTRISVHRYQRPTEGGGAAQEIPTLYKG